MRVLRRFMLEQEFQNGTLEEQTVFQNETG